MKINDAYYTSSKLAAILVRHVDLQKVINVADFCVGSGELLKAAEHRWTNINCYGTDISIETIRLLKEEKQKWNLNVCDFTDINSRNSTFLNGKLFDLILLNPPFTCKGSIVQIISYKGREYHVSTAVEFLVNALQYVTQDGALYSIVPLGILYSQKDSAIWDAISKDYCIKVHKEYERMYFKDSSPHIAIISIRKGITKKLYQPINKITLKQNIVVDIFRGKMSMYMARTSCDGFRIIHTTNLHEGYLTDSGMTSKSSSYIKGPAVLIARVGNPNIKKVCAISEDEEYTISDCIIAIKTRNRGDAKELEKMIIDDWDRFKKLYKGTGASYVTLERLRHYFLLTKG